MLEPSPRERDFKARLEACDYRDAPATALRAMVAQ